MIGAVDNKENLQIFLAKKDIRELSSGELKGFIFKVNNFQKHFSLRLLVSDNVGMPNGVNVVIDSCSYDVNIHKDNFQKLAKKGLLILVYDSSGLTICIYDKEKMDDIMLMSFADDLNDFAAKNDLVVGA